MKRTDFALSRGRRWWRLLQLGGNPLVRRWDRAERAVVVLAVLIAVVALPFAAALGSDTYGQQRLRAQTEAATRHPSTAVLLADAPPDTSAVRSTTTGGTALVRATWTRSDGTVATGNVAAEKGAVAGTRAPVWLDAHDNPVAAPIPDDIAVWNALGAGLFAWLGVAGICALLWYLAHLGLNRARYAQWEREWERELGGRV